MRGAALACLSLLLAAGCDRKPAEPPAAPPASVPVAEAPAPAAPVVGLEGAYAAISNTAVGVTGDLTASAGTLRFAQGQSYRLEGVSTLKGARAYASTQGSFAGLIDVPDTADLSLFKVMAEDPGKARNGGLCGATPTTYLVTYVGVDGSGAAGLFVIAFSGQAAPGANSPEAELCGTFMYAPKTG
ncbi:hypothetical protein GGQ61_000954 [Phenylobacterium haematophilum]|uniref:Lipoprotein n=1 Tax=Phenylobacterium haematophilum TaxID=98513 RepID=A0A839ZYN9_9CAUL|nr:hypothetical protein [Phenylobacterium haematophilum]MBB3890257.1 hypothetical protein [Phenylobacterium haematophilum]